MSDNTVLNIGLDGDVIVTEARPSDGYKIPVSKIRLGGIDIDGGDVTIDNPFPTLITDGVHGAVAVKAANTAAAATDASLVVALSPNSHLPTVPLIPGEVNILGSVQNFVTSPLASLFGLFATVSAYGTLRVTDEPSTVMFDSFNGTILNTTDIWSVVTQNGATETVLNSTLTLTTNKIVSASIAITTKQTFAPFGLGYSFFATVIKLGVVPIVGVHRFWGQGIAPHDWSAQNPLQDAIGFEQDYNGNLNAVVYQAGIKTYCQQLARPTDGASHRYATIWRTDVVIFYFDSLEIPVAVCNYPEPAVSDLPIRLHLINPTYVPSDAPTFVVTGIALGDTSNGNHTISDGKFPWRKASVAPPSTVPVATDTSLVVAMNPNAPLPAGTNLIGGTQSFITSPNAAPEGLYAYATSHGTLRVSDEPVALFNDNFDGTVIDEANRWTVMALNGGTATQLNGAVELHAGTAANAAAMIMSQPVFSPTGFSFYNLGVSIQLEAAVVIGLHRFWGFGSMPNSWAISTPLADAIGFEVDIYGKLNAVVYQSGTKTQSFALTYPTDGLLHRYMLEFRCDMAVFYIDTLEVPASTIIAGVSYPCFVNWPSVSTTQLPLHVHVLNPATSVSAPPTLICGAVGVSDSATNSSSISDGVYQWRKATVKRGSAAVDVSDNSLVVAQSPNSPGYMQGFSGYYPQNDSIVAAPLSPGVDASNNSMVRAAVFTDEGSYRDDFIGDSLTSVLSGTLSFTNGSLLVTGVDTHFTTEIQSFQYIRCSSDPEVDWAQVFAVQSDTQLTLETPYLGPSTDSATGLLSNCATSTAYGGSITVSNSNIALTTSLVSGATTVVYKQVDYCPITGTFYSAFTGGVVGQKGYVGFQDDALSVGAQAIVEFDGYLPTNQVRFVTSSAAGAAGTSSQIVTLPVGYTVDHELGYRITITNTAATLEIGLPNTYSYQTIAKSTIHTPYVYVYMSLVMGLTNITSIGSSATLTLDATFIENTDRVEIAMGFRGEPIYTELAAKNLGTMLLEPVNGDGYGNLSVALGVALPAGSNNIGAVTAQPKSTAATPTPVAASAISVTLLVANQNRIGATIFNNSDAILYVMLGAVASASSFTVKINAYGYYETPFGYGGIIAGIWSSATGTALITELV